MAKLTLLELFAQAYLTPQEIQNETRIPLETIYRMRQGKPVDEESIQRVLRMVSSRLGRTIHLSEIDISHFTFPE